MNYIKLGQAISRAKVSRCGDNDYPVLSITMKDGIVMQSDKFKKRIASKDISEYKVIPAGMLVQGTHMDEGNFGIQDIVPYGIVSPAYTVWTVDESVVFPKYIEMVLRSPRCIDYYRSKLNGTVNRRGHMSEGDFLGMQIPCPSIEEQKHVVTTMNQVKQVMISLTEEMTALDQLIKARFVELFGDVINNTMGWPHFVFSDIASSRLGKMLDAKQQSGKHQFPYLANFNVQWFRFALNNLNKMDFDEDDQAEFELKDGDLIVCEGGEIGRCAIWHNEIQPCYFQKALHRVRCNTDTVIPEYLAWWFQFNCEHGGFAAIEGAKATIAHLPGAKLKALQVAVPPLDLQKSFATFVSQVDKSKLSIQASLDQLETLKQSLMQKYFECRGGTL